MAVKIFTDSTADLSREFVKRYDIKVVPLTVHFGDEVYKDWYDMTSDQFFAKLQSSEVLPKTSQVAPNTFFDEFSKEIEKGNSIVCINLSSKASGTCQSARIAKEMLEDREIEVVDSKSYSFAIGIMVLKACQLAEQGLSAGEIAEEMRLLSDYMECYFVVDTLEYLKKGGRINAAEALIGNILNIKPFLKVIDGELKSHDKIRGSKKVIPRFIEEMQKTGIDFSSKTVGVAYGTDPGQADLLIEAIKEELKPAEILVGQVGSVIGTHSGPGILGVFFDTFVKK